MERWYEEMGFYQRIQTSFNTKRVQLPKSPQFYDCLFIPSNITTSYGVYSQTIAENSLSLSLSGKGNVYIDGDDEPCEINICALLQSFIRMVTGLSLKMIKSACTIKRFTVYRNNNVYPGTLLNYALNIQCTFTSPNRIIQTSVWFDERKTNKKLSSKLVGSNPDSEDTISIDHNEEANTSHAETFLADFNRWEVGTNLRILNYFRDISDETKAKAIIRTAFPFVSSSISLKQFKIRRLVKTCNRNTIDHLEDKIEYVETDLSKGCVPLQMKSGLKGIEMVLRQVYV
ncbi:hypothetical protein V1477_021147 [Vespula maculifrons]|uniref:Uncharacterized protein n=1 Tax=Vespula maculifrons TaxID=7453 RepID=A0ABD2AHJ9_VESMC